MKNFAVLLITAIVSALFNGITAPPVSTLNSWDSPCLTVDTEDPTNPRGVLNMTTDILRRTEGVEIQSRELKDFNVKEFNYATLTKNHLDLLNFIDTDKFTVTAEKLSAAVANPAQAVQSHYALMYELVAHVEKCRTDGQVKEMTGENSLKRKLHEIEVKLYDIICSMKIALRGEGTSTDHSVTEEVLSAGFLVLNNTLANETYRAYVVMNDSEGIMNYFREIYTNIQSSQTV